MRLTSFKTLHYTTSKEYRSVDGYSLQRLYVPGRQYLCVVVRRQTPMICSTGEQALQGKDLFLSLQFLSSGFKYTHLYAILSALLYIMISLTLQRFPV
jgi:hypothetical protein